MNGPALADVGEALKALDARALTSTLSVPLALQIAFALQSEDR